MEEGLILMTKKSKLLEQLGEEITKATKNINVNEIPIVFLEELTNNIKYEVIDYRANIAYQPLENIIMITFVGLLANCNEWTEIYEFAVLHSKWFEEFLDLKYGIPSISTIRKAMALVDPFELENSCVNIIINKIISLCEIFKSKNIDELEEDKKEKDVISYDGKVCRSSKRNCTINGEILPVNAMTAFNVTKDIPLATKFIDEKTNEIPTGPELIKLLDLTNTISTFDALNTQWKTIEAIANKGGDYVGALKGNQHNFYKDVVDYFDNKELYNEAYKNCHYEEVEKAHGCQEKRIYIMTENIEWLEIKKWKNLKSIGMCIREYEENEVKKKDIRYYISSLCEKEIKDFSRTIRDEWGIENNLHWQLDVTFKEDANRTMNKNAQANLNILRKLALNILKLVKPMYNKSLKLIRFRLGQNFEKEIRQVLLYLNTDELKKLCSENQ